MRVLIGCLAVLAFALASMEDMVPHPPAVLLSADVEEGVQAGVFRSTSSTEVAVFEQWAGHPVPYAIDWSSRYTWEEIANPAYMIDHWRGKGRRMVYGVAMLPENGQSTMAAGARGENNAHFRRLAEQLVAKGQADAIIRLGWEFNGNWYRWSAYNATEFKQYWRQVVDAMRAVPGQRFEFDWTVNSGEGQSGDAVDRYPGDDVVDYVGVDFYDASWAPNTYPYPSGCDAACRLTRQRNAWTARTTEPRGLFFWRDFARSHGKPLTVPEWATGDRTTDVNGGGDNPYYIEQMHRFVYEPANNVAYHSYFEVDGGGVNARLMTGNYPQAAGAYRRLFGGGPVPTAAPAPPPRLTSPPTGPVERVGDSSAGLSEMVASLSRATFPGSGSASSVVLARDDVFADSLAGAALAGVRGPLLYTPGGPGSALETETAAELTRVLRPGGTVYLMGGEAAVSERVQNEVSALNFVVRRVQGSSRIETALRAADAVMARAARDTPTGESTRVLLARDDDWVDAVTGGAYAAEAGVPLLLTGSDQLHPAVATWLAAHHPAEVVLLGGEAALAPPVAAEVSARAESVRRVGGSDRAETAAAVARELWGREEGLPGDRFVVADGYGADVWGPALAATPLSAVADAPQLLVSVDELPSGTRDYLSSLSYDRDQRGSAMALGGAVPPAVAAELTDLLGG